MKCEKCNNNEANFYYSSNINGVKTERHLCADCAREEGFGSCLDYQPVSAFNSMFGSMMSDFFTPMRSMASAFGGFGLPMGGIMAPTRLFPQIQVYVGGAPEQSGSTIPADAGEDVKARRELEALKNQLSEAVKAEDFEKAIELRDKIKEMQK
ncbi:MAG: UvrB/UvrC motif-containing protein [Oscillospiraceae bacterium]|nr:UvrB/UvrC motif-containing protein [Oscillospiraceae bacterium]MCC8079396.1 UvrB/UvrC motif-containing protein [Oscillospiraceae bacterium]MCD8192659.1 UvrB/UvrC motif-containing protein [Oscillospiraceae bacterium]MCD8343578.1 UvrB/UvrC motif-containing protein [Oscillospiraceae bacterium]MCD8375243.1 UvrB/UvrC motif-containing protein [Oscillospiraceae bacterium]